MQQLIAALNTENAASALSELTAMCKKQSEREALDALLGEREAVKALLKDPAPKARKNAARLLGALGHMEDGAALAEALTAEQTRFVVPSLLLALGSVGGDAAKAALDGFIPPVAADDTEQKHCLEIAEAYRKATASVAAASDEPLPVYRLEKETPVLLTAPAGFAITLCEELTELGYAPIPAKDGALVTTDNLQKLYRARCFDMALLPIGKDVPLDATCIAAAAKPHLTLPWRVELTDYTGDRAAFIRALCQGIGQGNAPSRYALELRVHCHGKNCDLYLRAASVPDGRFAYRKRAIPASIAPATAACLARLAASAYVAGFSDAEGQAVRKHTLPRSSEQATPENQAMPGNQAMPVPVPAPAPHVLDPFCGSGTMLFELEKRMRCASLTGVDLSAHALEAARVNAAAAHSKAGFVQKDVRRFTPNAPYDIVIANLPFGNRVGTHENNKPLYREFVARLPQTLTERGVAVLYTMEYQLLTQCIRHTPALTLAASQRTEAGGLLPWVFLLRRAPDGQA